MFRHPPPALTRPRRLRAAMLVPGRAGWSASAARCGAHPAPASWGQGITAPAPLRTPWYDASGLSIPTAGGTPGTQAGPLPVRLIQA